MGYDRAAALDVYRLSFEEYPGLTVHARRPSFVAERALEAALPVLRNRRAGRRAGRRAQQQALDLAAKAMGSALVEWDLEWAGQPVPANHAGLVSLDTEFLLTLLAAWVEQVAARPAAPQAEVEQPEVDLPDVDPALADIPMLELPAQEDPAVDQEGPVAVEGDAPAEPVLVAG